MKVNAPLKLTLLSLSLLQCMSAIASDTEVNKEDKLPSVTLAPIVVTAENISSHKLLGGAQSTLSKDIESLNSNLKSQRAVSLGQTVEKISGVQNNSFGANNGIPQIRSLTNSRVRINNNGMGVAGLATISGNLPTAINPALADSIDVYKSSASVLYGGNAIGGVVNVNTSQIPTSLPDSSIKGEVEVSGGNNVTSDQSFQLTGKLGQFAWYLDAMNSHVDDYDIPGNAKADACYDINNIWRMGKNGMGENTSLARACQMKVVTEQKFNPKYYQLINKEFLTALNAGEDAVQAYKDKYGLGTVKGEYKDASKINWKSPMYLRVWKNKNQFKSLPAEQQKIILEEKWGGYVIPNYNKLSLNPVYEAGQSENLEVLKTFEDMVATEKGKMTNSHMDNKTVSTGLSYIGKNGYAGIGMSYYKNDYGVPGYASLTTKTNVTTINKQPVNIESKQKKLSFESGYSPSITGIDNISAKVNYIDAINEEYLGSTFANQLNAKQVEARVELNHYWNDVASGSIGIDSTRRKTDGSGQDRFLPDTKSRQYGIFALQQLNGEGWQAKAGYRNEKVKHQSFFDDGYTSSQGGNANQGKYSENVRDFNLHNYFIDMNWQPIDFLSLTARYSRSQRAPEVNELFASNFHFATLTDEQGSPSLNKETAKTLELGGQVNWESGKFSVNHFNTDYDDSRHSTVF